MKWEIELTNKWEEAKRLAKEGWEPFAVLYSYMYFRRPIKEEVKN